MYMHIEMDVTKMFDTYQIVYNHVHKKDLQHKTSTGNLN